MHSSIAFARTLTRAALVAVLWAAASLASGQSGGPGEYRTYTLRHKSAAEVERLLTEMLGDMGPATHVINDAPRNQLLIRGPDRAHEVARQLVESLDHPPPQGPAEKPLLRTYPCDPLQLPAIAENVRTRYGNQPGVRIAADPSSSQLLVLAPAGIQAILARELAVPTAPIAAAAPGAPIAPMPPVTQAVERFVPASYVPIGQVELKLRELLAPNLTASAPPQPATADYRWNNDQGLSLDLRIDRQQNGVHVRGPAPLVEQLVRLVKAVDGPPQATGTATRILPLRRAAPVKVQEALDAYEGKGLPASQPQPGDSSRYYVPGSVQLAAALQQPQAAGQPPPAAAIPATEEEQRAQETRGIGRGVQIETLPDLDVMILRGRDRDVEEIAEIIAELERLSAEFTPMIDVHMLRYVDCEALANLIEDVEEALTDARQGNISVFPLVKPNALLLIGWGEAMGAVRELIQKVDQPVPPQTQLEVFALKNASVTTASTTIQQFFAGRQGLNSAVEVVPDMRTNSLIVRAAPRDMQEVRLLIERLDRGGSEIVTQTRLFKLQNTLATDLANTLDSAISAARGGTQAGRNVILQLLDVDPQQQKILESGMLGNVEVTADPHTNTLVVTGPAESMGLIAELIRQLDSPTGVAQIKVFRIINGEANSMVEMLRTLLAATAQPGPQLAGAEGESPLVPLRFAVDARTNSIIATGSESELMIVEALLLRLDEEDDQQRQTSVYRLKNAPALDVANSVNLFLRSERQVQQAVPGALNPFQRIESEVVVVPEVVSNSLIISATPRFYEEIMKLVEDLDQQPPQVMIQVLIAEVALRNIKEFGIELGLQDSLLFDRSVVTDNLLIPGYNFNNQPLGNSSSAGSLARSENAAGQALSNFTLGRTNSNLGYGGLVLAASSESISMLVRALQESRKLEVLGRPQVMTLDNQSAFVQVGQRVPRIIGSAVTYGGNVINSVALENVGLILGVTPRISPEGTVIMEVDAERSKINFDDGVPIAISEGQPIISPSIDLTVAQTTVSAADGETVVIGGLISKNKSRTERRVPWLSDIPLLGLLFRYDSDADERNELLIILTPHVVRSQADVERVKQIEAARMNWCLADVHAVHGPTGICEHCGKVNCQCAGTVVYPDTNPRGQSTGEYQPQEAAPDGLPLAPPIEAIPTPPPLSPPADPALEEPMPAVEQPSSEPMGSDKKPLMNQ